MCSWYSVNGRLAVSQQYVLLAALCGKFQKRTRLIWELRTGCRENQKMCPHVISVPRKSQVQAESGAYGVGSAWAPIQNFPRAADGVSEREPLALARSPRFSHGCSRTGREGKGGGEGESGEPGASEGGRECGSWREGGRAGFIGRGSMQS